MTKKFVVISDGDSVMASELSQEQINALKKKGFVLDEYPEDFLNDAANDEKAIFIIKESKDIVSLYDRYNMYSLPYAMCNDMLHKFSGEHLCNYV